MALTWLATYLRTVRHLSVLGTGGYLGINICRFVLRLRHQRAFERLARTAEDVRADGVRRRGHGRVLHAAPLGDTAVLLLGFPLGFFQSGIIAGMGATFAELFPTRVRATGQGFSYNTGRAVGSFVPDGRWCCCSEHGALAKRWASAPRAHTRSCSLAVALLPETRGRELESTVAPETRGTLTAAYSPQPVPR